MKFNDSKRITKLFFLYLAIIILAGCGATGLINLQSGNHFAKQDWDGADSSLTVPFNWHDGHVIISIAINSQQNLRFALDSGAAATVLFETERTKDLPLSFEMQIDLKGRKVNVVNDAVIAVGQITLSEMTIIQVPIDQSPLFGSYDEAYFDGAIGFDVLSRYMTRINYADKTVTFIKDSSTALKSAEWIKLPMAIHGRIPYISGAIPNQQGHPAYHDLIVDTGAPDYLYINSSLASDFTFPSSYFESKTTNFDGEHTVKTSRIDYFQVAGSSFDNIAVHNLPYFEDDNGIGLIGSGLLRNFDVVFNYKNGYLALKKNRQFSPKTLIDRSGLQLEPHRKGGLVKGVGETAGLKVLKIAIGDVVTKINGHKINDISFDEIRSLLSSEAEQVELCWTSSGDNMCGTLVLQDRI
jgi:predicted aspartyl protease